MDLGRSDGDLVASNVVERPGLRPARVIILVGL